MDRCLPGLATGVDAMSVITFDRTIVVPVSLVVLALAGLTAPSLLLQGIRVLGATVVIGLIVLAVTRWWQASTRRRPRLTTDDGLQVAKNDATDIARMGSDAG
jgi:hypothetical protein